MCGKMEMLNKMLGSMDMASSKEAIYIAPKDISKVWNSQWHQFLHPQVGVLWSKGTEA